MKINKIECPSCGHPFNLDNIDENNICECPACKSYLHIDDEKDAPAIVTININNYADKGTPTKVTTRPNSITTAIAFLSILLVISFVGYQLYKIDHINTQDKEITYRTTPNSEPVILFAEKIFGKKLADVTTEDYETLSYLRIERNCPPSDWTNADSYPWKFTYSFTVDDNGHPQDVNSMLIESDKNVEKKDIQAFTHLIIMEFGQYGGFEWDANSYSGLDYTNLKKLKHYEGDNFSSLIEAFDDPSNIESLSLNGLDIADDSELDISIFSGLKTLTLDYVDDRDNLDEIGKLKNLESLKIDYLDNGKKNTLDFLSSLTKLKSLELEFATDTGIANSNVFYGLPSIEKLILLHVSDLKSIDFIKTMPKLHSLTINSCPIISIEPIRDNITITELSLNDLSYLNDISALPTLTSLRKLELDDVEVSTEAIPSLDSLSMLTELRISGEYLDAISGMTGIEKLTIGDNYYSEASILSTLEGLKQLKLELSSQEPVTAEQIAELPNLEDLEVYLDFPEEYYIDPLFSSKSIKSLTISSSDIHEEAIYVDFNTIPDNDTLKKLSINDINVVDISGDNEEKSFGEYSSPLLSHFKGLEELSVKENQITSLDFVSNMPKLRILDISDNYVSDMSPLLDCKNLETLICKNNPIANLNIIPENVTVYSK